MRVADYIFEFLGQRGAKHVFLLPGGGAMHLVDAVGQSEDTTYVATHHEQAASIAAEAYSRIPGRLGCALVTTGPGVTNAMTGVAGAWIDSVPMFVISGQVKRADLMGDTGVRQMGPQEVDVQALASGITKYCVTVMEPEDIRYHLEAALHQATTGRPGPVWLDIPLDVQASMIEPGALRGFEDSSGNESLSADAVAEIEAAIRGARKPLIFAGHGVRLSGAAEPFRELIEKLQVPVVATWNAMDLVPWDNPLFVGRPGSVALRAPNFAVQNCDLLLCLGTRLDNVVTAFNPGGFGKLAKKILVDIDPAETAKLGDSVDHAINADLGELIPGLLSSMSDNPPARQDAWIDQCNDWKKRYQVTDFGDNEAISHYAFVDALSDAVPADTLVSTGSSGLAVEVFYEVFRVKQGQRVYLTSGLGAMGYGLPAAIGACFANDCQPMVAVESDGSLQLNLQELNTLKAHNLPMRLVIMNNGGYCSIRTTQRNYFEGRYVGTGPEARLFLPDLEKLAAVYDFPFVRISDIADLERLKDVMNMPGPVICEVMLAENEALRPKVAAIVQDDGSMVSMPLEDMTPLLPLEEMQEIMGDNLSEASINAKRQ